MGKCKDCKWFDTNKEIGHFDDIPDYGGYCVRFPEWEDCEFEDKGMNTLTKPEPEQQSDEPLVHWDRVTGAEASHLYLEPENEIYTKNPIKVTCPICKLWLKENKKDATI